VWVKVNEKSVEDYINLKDSENELSSESAPLSIHHGLRDVKRLIMWSIIFNFIEVWIEVIIGLRG
jgi:hypothetical protein